MDERDYADGTDPEYDDGTDPEYGASDETHEDVTPPEDDDEELPAEAMGDNPEIVVDEGNVFDVPEDMLTGAAGQVPAGEGVALRRPVPDADAGVGIVPREPTEAGEYIDIEHGRVSHEVDNPESGKAPWERCPECGDVNLAYHNKTRTSAHCVHCGWQSSNLKAAGNPPGKIPGLHEVDGVHAEAGEVPKAKLEGAANVPEDENPKEGVKVADIDRPVTSMHTGGDGALIGQSNYKAPETEDEES